MSPASGTPPSLRLVVIDDDPKNLKFVNFILANAGLEIHTASEPQEGLDLIRRLRPQIVLTDLVMPGVQGMELLQKIVEFDPGIDVILMTGYYSPNPQWKLFRRARPITFQSRFRPKSSDSESDSSLRRRNAGSAVPLWKTNFWRIFNSRASLAAVR